MELIRTNPIASGRAVFFGRATLDALYWVDGLPEEDTKVYAERLYAAAGGPALNAAIVHSLLNRFSGIEGFPGQTLLVSAVGGGPWAAVIRAELAGRGIELLDLAAGTAYEAPLVTALVDRARATRTVINPPLARVVLATLAGEWEQAVPAEWGVAPPVVLTDGFHVAETLGLLRGCREAGAAICLDGGSWKSGTEELAPLLTAAICGERFQIPDLEAGAEAVFNWFAGQGVPSVAVTRGARSILGRERGRRFEIEVEAVETVDTLGAGDVLHGAFCYFYGIDQDFEGSLRRAAQVATCCCQSVGIVSGIERWAAQA
jgi:sugar/nucleoside kinase (ribokinase family)